MINRKSRDEIKRMRHAGHSVALVHKKMREVGQGHGCVKIVTQNLPKHSPRGMFLLSFLIDYHKTY